jgi:hypothetical protein
VCRLCAVCDATEHSSRLPDDMKAGLCVMFVYPALLCGCWTQSVSCQSAALLLGGVSSSASVFDLR